MAIATTPLAFAVLGRLEWFKARRGRVMQRPEFSSIVVGMMLVMGIPAIFAALVLKSRSFDRNRYEFDPNRTWSVLEQGRGFKSLEEADAAVKREMERLALERKNLVDNVKKLDEAMLALRAVAGTSPAVAQAVPGRLAVAGRRAQERGRGRPAAAAWTSPRRRSSCRTPGRRHGRRPAPSRSPPPAAAAPVAGARGAAGPATGLTPGPGRGRAGRRARAAARPSPPCCRWPACRRTGPSASRATRYIETFNADNLYEKIDGRAESFLQYGVKGMAYTFYHPTGDPSNELQLYIFEMADPLKALGKYGSEKPDEAKVDPGGRRGLHRGRQHALLRGQVLHPDRLDQGRPQVRRVRPGAGQARRRQAEAGSAGAGAGQWRRPRARSSPKATAGRRSRRGQAATPSRGRGGHARDATSPSCRPGRKQGDPSTSPRTSSATASSPTSSWPITRRASVTWQGFLRPYADAKEAKAVLEKYIARRQEDGAEIKTLEAEGADEMVVSSNIGLVDVVFRKGNTWPGPTAPPALKPAEAFARALAKSLPAQRSRSWEAGK